MNYVVLNDAESLLRRRTDWDDASDFTVTEALNKWNRTLRCACTTGAIGWISGELWEEQVLLNAILTCET